MLVTKDGIKVVRLIHTERGLVDMDDLVPEEKARAATQIALTYLNELYRGKAVFTAEGENQ